MLFIYWLILANQLVAQALLVPGHKVPFPRVRALASNRSTLRPLSNLADDSQIVGQFSFRSILKYFRGEDNDDDCEDDSEEEELGTYELENSESDVESESDNEPETVEEWYYSDSEEETDDDSADGFIRFKYYSIPNGTTHNSTEKVVPISSVNNTPEKKMPSIKKDKFPYKDRNNIYNFLNRTSDDEIISAAKNFTGNLLGTKMFRKVVSGLNTLVSKGLNRATKKMNDTEIEDWVALYNIVLNSEPTKAISHLVSDEKSKSLIKNAVYDSLSYAHKKAQSMNMTQIKLGYKTIVDGVNLVTTSSVSGKAPLEMSNGQEESNMNETLLEYPKYSMWNKSNATTHNCSDYLDFPPWDDSISSGFKYRSCSYLCVAVLLIPLWFVV
ncbi:hypothetical protein G9P44_000247 [Scheffersomyces stipitis]|nr:hypothetical protein G9P44_000247 [Scheffersomyces stipitis]